MYPNRRGLERRWALALLLLAATAWAHDADVVYAMLSDAPGGQLEEQLTLTAGTLSLLAPIDADRDGALSQADLDARADAIAAGVWDQVPLAGGLDGAGSPCVRSAEQAILREGYVELSARFACPDGPLSQDFRILRGLTTNYRVVLGRQGDGEGGRAFAQGNVQRLVVRAELPPPASAGLGFTAGVLSVLIWLDVTLLWLLALALAGSLKQVGWAWTALVTGHGAGALALGALGARPPEWLGAALVAGIGGGFALQVLASERARWPLLALGLLGVAASLRDGVGASAAFQAGRGAGLLLLLAALAGPGFRLLARRPGLKRKVEIGLCCASLAAVGFSLVQTVRTF